MGYPPLLRSKNTCGQRLVNKHIVQLVQSISISKTVLRLSEKNSIRFLILQHVFYLIFNIVQSELLNVKIEKSKFNQILNWISFCATYPSSNFLIFVTSKLLSVKTEEFKTDDDDVNFNGLLFVSVEVRSLGFGLGFGLDRFLEHTTSVVPVISLKQFF